MKSKKITKISVALIFAFAMIQSVSADSETVNWVWNGTLRHSYGYTGPKSGTITAFGKLEGYGRHKRAKVMTHDVGTGATLTNDWSVWVTPEGSLAKVTRTVPADRFVTGDYATMPK